MGRIKPDKELTIGTTLKTKKQKDTKGEIKQDKKKHEETRRIKREAESNRKTEKRKKPGKKNEPKKIYRKVNHTPASALGPVKKSKPITNCTDC